jgi:putative transposase
MRKLTFADDGIYHVFNRGVEKRSIFLDNQDHYRFIHCLFDLNNDNHVVNSRYYFDPEIPDLKPGTPRKNKEARECLVDVLVFTLMPNHFHLLLRQRKKDGIQRFIQKVCVGYVMYFNKKYERSGVLFQGRFKAVEVDKNEYFQYLPHYIHLNPLCIKGNKTGSWREAYSFLENYKWSSFPDYIGKKNFPSVTKRDMILGIFGNKATYRRNVREILREKDGNRKKWPESIHDLKLD